MNIVRRSVPGIFYLLMTLSGIATSIILYIWFRQYTVFFGTHTVSTSTIAATILACMAFGSLFTGMLADKINRRLTFFAILTGITGIYILLHPYLFQVMTVLFRKINNVIHPGPFGMEILRLFLSFFFLLIPAGIMAGSFTLLIRYFIRHNGQTGKFMSAVIVSGSAGVAAGMSLTSLYLIPYHSFRIAEIFAAAIFLLIAAITIFFMLHKRLKSPGGHVPVLTYRVRKSSLRFKKRKTVLETGVKLTRALVRVYAFQGFTTTAYLLICFRVLAYYSEIKPVYFQSLVIIVFFSGLALGSSLYKRISEKPANSYLTMATFQILTGFTAVLSYAALYLIQKVVNNQANEIVTFAGLLIKHLLLYATLILFPAFIMGLSLPLAGKLYPKRLQKTGSSFGRLGLIWLLSALSGVIITRFVLIPLTGLYYAYFTLVLFVILSGIYLILRDSRLIRGFRLGYAILSFLVYVALIGVFKKTAQPVKEIEGSTTSVSTVEKSDGSMTVQLNNHYYFSSDQEGMKVQQLPAYLPMLLDSNIHSVLVIGFGMGTTASALEENGVSDIHIAEIFPEIIRFSSDVFADANDDIMTSSHVNITIEDARSYLIRMVRKVDLITTGCAQLAQMPNNYTTEFYSICFKKLSDKGLICQVLPTDGITANEFKALLKACSIVFPEVSLWYLTPERILMVGAKMPEKPELCRLSSSFSVLNSKDDLTSIGISNVESLIAQLLLDDRQLRSYVNDASENTDNKPFVQYSRKTDKNTDAELLKFLVNIQIDYNDLFQAQGNCTQEINKTIVRIKQFKESLKQQMVPSSGSL